MGHRAARRPSEGRDLRHQERRNGDGARWQPIQFMVIEAGKEQLGFTYLAVLFFVAVAGIGLGAAGLTWATMQQREKEKELLFVGNQFRMAIGRYYNSTPGSIKRYPVRLTELLKDNRHLAPQRYLRKIYIDPMTATTDGGLVYDPDGAMQLLRYCVPLWGGQLPD